MFVNLACLVFRFCSIVVVVVVLVKGYVLGFPDVVYCLSN